jgi:periplasmic protein CpxP/Spy
MKSPLTAALLLGAMCSSIAGTSPLFAADETAPAPAARSFPAPEEVVKSLTDKLSLSADQASKITPIIADRQQQLKAIMANTSLSRMERMQQSKTVFGDSDAKLNAILTPDQQTKYAAIKEQMREQGRHRMQPQ